MSRQDVSQKNVPIGQMLLNSTLFYGGMAVIALLIVHFQHQGIPVLFSWNVPSFSITQLLTLTALSIGVLLIGQFLLEEFFPSFKAYKSVLVQYIGGLQSSVGIYLAVITAVAEQLMFQGAIQPEVGAPFTAVLFTLVHLGPGNRIGSWTLMAFITGIIFAWMYAVTASIWPSLLGHIIVKIASFMLYRRAFKKLMQQTDGNIIQTKQ